MGINTRVDLAVAHDVLRQEKMRDLMLSGVTVVDPKTTYVDQTVEVGKDTILYPNCLSRGEQGLVSGVSSNPTRRSQTPSSAMMSGSSQALSSPRVQLKMGLIGPFAHLRPLSEIKTKAKIGNFVEVKKSVIGKGSKANHLTYIGDSIVGEDVNIGAGTITCNYDGFEKHQTIIGDRVFVGSNVELVAPVKVGNGSSIGAGTTITKDVPAGALAISRVKQKNIKGWDKKVEPRRPK